MRWRWRLLADVLVMAGGVAPDTWTSDSGIDCRYKNNMVADK